MPAIAYNDTPVVDKPWDGPGAEAAIPNDASASTLRAEYAWTATADSTKKSDYKLPHHEVADGRPGAANVRGVRNALARLPQTTGIPRADFQAIRTHLNRHISKFNASSGGGSNSQDIALETALVVEAEGHIWAVRPEMLSVIGDLHGRVVSDVMLQEIQEAQVVALSGGTQVQGNSVAVIPLKGLLTPTPSLLSLLFGGGGSGLLAFRSSLRSAAANPDISSIVLDVDSPGGYVDLIPEIAADIRAAADQKPVVSVANTMAASAAYWLAAQAHEVVASPSAEVGSIGVYQIHLDKSQALADAGVVPTIVKAGRYKIENNPYSPMSDAGRAQMQENVDTYYDMFTQDVATGRAVPLEDVQAGFGEGRTLTSKAAVSAGLADRVATLEQTVSRLASGRARVRRASDGQEYEVAAGATDGAGLKGLSPEQRGRLFDVMVG